MRPPHIDLLRGGEYQRYLNAPDLLAAEVKERLKNASGIFVVAIDEIQKLPSLLDEVHALIEDHKGSLFQASNTVWAYGDVDLEDLILPRCLQRELDVAVGQYFQSYL